MNIDCDTHFTPKEFYTNISPNITDCWRLVTGPGGLEQAYFPPTEAYREMRRGEYDIELRKQAMKEAGFDKQCLLKAVSSIPQAPGLVKPETVHYLVKRWNDLVAKVVEADDSFIGIAQIPHDDPVLAIEEAERAVKELGFRAIEFNGSWMGKNIEDPEWWPFFEAFERLHVPLWYHGSVPSGPLRKANYPTMVGFEQLERVPYLTGPLTSWLWQAQLIVLGMVFSGLLDKYPAIKIAMTEVDASWVPSFMGHMDLEQNHTAMLRNVPKAADGTRRGYNFHTKDGAGIRKRASSYMREHFLFAVNDDSEYELNIMLPVLVKRVQMRENIMIMSDYDHVEGSLNMVRRIRGIPDITEDDKDMICGKNAERLLNV